MAENKIAGLSWLIKQVENGDLDFLKGLVQSVVKLLMSAEADSICGAAYGEKDPERTNHRNGYRVREWDTRVGTIPLEIPKLRRGSYFPDWLLQNRRRAERALVQVVTECYVRGVSLEE